MIKVELVKVFLFLTIEQSRLGVFARTNELCIQMHEDHVPVFLRYCQVMTLRIDLQILMLEQVMTSSVVVPLAVYLNKNTS